MRIINHKANKEKRNTDHRERSGRKLPERLRRTGGCGKKLVRCGLLLLLVISLFVYRDSWREIFTGIRQADWRDTLAGTALAAGAYLLEGMAIFLMMEAMVPGNSALEGVRIAFLCEFYRLATLGNGAGIAEIHYLHRDGIEPGSGTVLTMLQYMWKKVAIMALGTFAFAVLYRGGNTRALLREYALFMGYGCAGTLAVIGVFLCLIFSERLADLASAGLRGLAGKLPSGRERVLEWERQVRLLNQSGKSVLEQKRKMGCVLLCQMGKLLLFYGIPVCMLRGGDVTGPECVSLMAVAYLLSGVIPTPSGAGSLEFIFLLFFTGFVALDKALAAILVFRFATWIMPFAVGGVLLGAERIRERRARDS